MPERISNNPANFEEGGLYPGGKNLATSVKYALWDYGGTKPPNSFVCVEMTCQPLDGSNDGKEHVVNWNVGPAADFAPDHLGGSLIPLRTRDKQSTQSNWAHVLKQGFMLNCGLDPEKIDTEVGITALNGTEVVLARVDPPKRDFGDDAAQAPPQPGQQPPKRSGGNKILLPTWAKFPWEKGTKGATAAATTAVAKATPSAASKATMGLKAEANGSTGGTSFADIVEAIMTANKGTFDAANLAVAVGEQCVLLGIGRADKIALLKSAKDVEALKAVAAEKGWTLEDGILIG